MGKNNTSISETLINMIVDMYKKGVPASKIAQELKLDEVTVHKYLTATGTRQVSEYISDASGKRLSKEDINKILRMYKKGDRIAEISRAMNISPDTIYRHVNKANIPTRSGKMVSKDVKRKIVELVEKKGYTGAKAAEELDISVSTVYRTMQVYRQTGTV